MAEIKRLRPKQNKKLDQIIHNVWGMMKNRCYNKNNPDYHNWGGRGITVCTKWLYYEGFLEDMREGYVKGLTLDRIDNNGNYCKENCRWVDRKVQNNNRRDNQYFEKDGVKMTLGGWAELLKVNRSTLAQRYYSYKWSTDRVLTSDSYNHNQIRRNTL